MTATGKIIVLAYPDTFVTMSTEWICKVLPWFGLGTKEYIKAGHAALVVIDNKSAGARYFDFGRYVTPEGYGRVRGANTDAELFIPFRAQLSQDNVLENLDEFLLWLDAHPQKTHGQGRLLASVCEEVDVAKAMEFISSVQVKGSIPYGAFNREGSNCARFVTDTLIASATHKSITKALLWNKRFTPSTVGNVVKCNLNRRIFEVSEGVIKSYEGTALKENLTNYFDRKKPITNKLTPLATPHLHTQNHIQKLAGTGSSAWFEWQPADLPPYHFRICRYNELGEMDFDGVYFSEGFDPSQPFTFTYDSHCQFCHVLQVNKKLKLKMVNTFADFNSRRKPRSA